MRLSNVCSRKRTERTPTRILAYCVMPNHWHFVLRPKGDGELTRFRAG